MIESFFTFAIVAVPKASRGMRRDIPFFTVLPEGSLLLPIISCVFTAYWPAMLEIVSPFSTEWITHGFNSSCVNLEKFVTKISLLPIGSFKS